ncbi:MAG TPA: UDP-N-acetylmuramate--L-alanine ligase [Planctomycetota bacterium]|nr:UDP-N-acetylmuramate--L-alanine ligase [Planctomycetota bacterium]
MNQRRGPSDFSGRHVHLMGIGGAGVSALVPLLQKSGAAVSGCDVDESPVVRRLRAHGFRVGIGHSPSHLDGVDIVVHTGAIAADHPELARARAEGIEVLTRAACLVRLMAGRRTLAVAGSHGKSSTTWMLGHLLAEAGADPVVMVGGSVAALGGTGARAGGSDLFVAETDESDGSFAQVQPEVAVVTNLDHEHLRHYGSFTALEDAFGEWLSRVPRHGAVVVPATGLGPRVAANVSARLIRVGLDGGDYHAVDLDLGGEGSRCRVRGYGDDLGELVVPIPGAHMVHNALMAVAAAKAVRPEVKIAAMARCERVRRRFTVHGKPKGVRVVEDYGHHPAEVRATIGAARLGGGRVHVIFQPHRYTRTQDCFDDFTAAFDQAHAVVVLPIYAASEQPIPGVDHASLAHAIAGRRSGLGEERALVKAFDDWDAAVDLMVRNAKPGDTCLVLGAGDVGQLAPLLVERLEAQQ